MGIRAREYFNTGVMNQTSRLPDQLHIKLHECGIQVSTGAPPGHGC